MTGRVARDWPFQCELCDTNLVYGRKLRTDRVAREGRLLADSTGDRFVFSTIPPRSMARRELYAA